MGWGKELTARSPFRVVKTTTERLQSLPSYGDMSFLYGVIKLGPVMRKTDVKHSHPNFSLRCG